MEEALQITQLITNIIIILLFLGVLIVLFGLIKSAKKITEKVEVLTKDFADIKPKVYETVDKANSLSDNVNSFVSKINKNVDVLEDVVDKVKDTADSILDFEKRIQSKIEPPVMDTVNTISAVSVGVKTFFDSLKKNKSKKFDEVKQSEKIEDLEDTMADMTKELEEVNARLTDLQK